MSSILHNREQVVLLVHQAEPQLTRAEAEQKADRIRREMDTYDRRWRRLQQRERERTIALGNLANLYSCNERGQMESNDDLPSRKKSRKKPKRRQRSV